MKWKLDSKWYCYWEWNYSQNSSIF